MGVKIRERKAGQWWLFVTHKGNRMARLAGSEAAAIVAKEYIEGQLASRTFVLPKKEAKQSDGKKAVPSLAEYYGKFQASYLKTAVRESTAERYGQCFKHHILPILGDKALDGISRESLKDLIGGLVQKKLAKCTIRNVTACRCSVLSHAVEDRLIVYNPATRLGRYFKQARVVPDHIEPLTEDEIPLFLAATSARDGRKPDAAPEYYPMFLCALHTGMRAGEISGLQWGDIDFNGKFMVVRRSIKKGRVNPTKTDRIRRIDISDDLRDELAAYRRRRLEAAMRIGKNEIPPWVFGSGNGSPLDMHNVERPNDPSALKRPNSVRFAFTICAIRRPRS